MAKNFYEILGVSKNASDAELKKAYKTLALKWHPDKHSDPAAKTQAEQKFRDIAEAYEVLSDKEKRRKYDLYCETGSTGAGGSPAYNFPTTAGWDPSELFARHFSSDHRFFFMNSPDRMKKVFHPNLINQMNSGQQKSPEPKVTDLNCSLEDLYNGSKKSMQVSRERYNEGKKVFDKEVLVVDIKPGWKDGTRLTYKGAGNQESASSPPSDLIFVVKTKKHPRFVRSGDNLIYKYPVTLVKALTGFTVFVEFLDSRTTEIQINQVISPRSRKVIGKEGMPNAKNNERGDMIIEFDIIFPPTLTPEQKTELKRILKQ